MSKQTASARETMRNCEHHHTTIHTTHPFVEIWRFRKLLKMRSLRWGFGVEPYYPKLHQPCCRVCACVSASQRRKLVRKSFREIWNVPQRRDTRRKEENHHTTIHTTRSDRVPHAKTSNYEATPRPTLILVRENVSQFDSQSPEDCFEFVECDVVFATLDPVKRCV